MYGVNINFSVGVADGGNGSPVGCKGGEPFFPYSRTSCYGVCGCKEGGFLRPGREPAGSRPAAGRELCSLPVSLHPQADPMACGLRAGVGSFPSTVFSSVLEGKPEASSNGGVLQSILLLQRCPTMLVGGCSALDP